MSQRGKADQQQNKAISNILLSLKCPRSFISSMWKDYSMAKLSILLTDGPNTVPPVVEI